MGCRNYCYCQDLRSYLTTIIGFNWFGFLVLLGFFICVSALLYFIKCSKFPENNHHLMHSNTIKINSKFKKKNLHVKQSINFQFNYKSSTTLRLFEKASFINMQASMALHRPLVNYPPKRYANIKSSYPLP